MPREFEAAEVFNHSKLFTASCLVYSEEGAGRKCVREGWVEGRKGEGRERGRLGGEGDIRTGQVVNWNTPY